MLSKVSDEIRHCLEHARDCARRAEEAASPAARDDFLQLEQNWLALARSYEFAQRLSSFNAETALKKREGT